MNDVIVRIDRLTKSYKNCVAVDGISFDIEKGRLLSLLGPNGAGKTTTLECMEGILKADSGTIELKSGKIGIQLQSSALPENLTVLEAMGLFCAYRKIPVRTDLLKRFGLDEKKNTQYCNLSTGQKRRLTLAMSVIHNPDVLFLDEPTAGLDVQSRIELHEVIRELKKNGTTILLATHDMAEAETLSDRIIILCGGKIATEGTPAEITAAGSTFSKISLRTEAGLFLEPVLILPGAEEIKRIEDYAVIFSSNVENTTTAILQMIKHRGDKLLDLRIERPSLEERFVEIIKKNRSAEGVLS